MRESDRPIGVFDSGIGGLTVFKELARRMPQENLIYFGDTAHVPYGSKSREAVTRYSLEIARFLAGQNIKALVIACNTSSALALAAVQAASKAPVIGVIEPGARAAAAATRSGRVGIIGTEATIASGAYEKALRRKVRRLRVVAAACPLLVPLVEEGWWAHPVTSEVTRHYLAPLRGRGLDTLILGCTHYPLLKAALQKAVGSRVRLIDSAEETAIETERRLDTLGLRRRAGRGWRRYYVSDAPRRFLKLSRRLLGMPVTRVSLHSFDA